MSILYSEELSGHQVGDQWEREPYTRVQAARGPFGSLIKVIEVYYQPNEHGSPRLYNRVKLRRSTIHARLSFWVKFKKGFQFVKGGKLLGLSPDKEVSGGGEPEPESWSSRVMWREHGRAQTYDYHQLLSEKWGEGAVTALPVFSVGTWHFVELEVQLNHGCEPGFSKLSVDGKEASYNPGRSFRTDYSRKSEISHFTFATFFGGSNPSWAPSKQVEAQFCGITVQDLDTV